MTRFLAMMRHTVSVCAFVVTSLLLTPLAHGQTIWHVDANAPPPGNGTSWPTAFSNLDAALAAAANSIGGDVIKVAQGTYTPTVQYPPNQQPPDPRSVTFRLFYSSPSLNHNNVTIRGGYRGGQLGGDLRDPRQFVTILSGDLNHDDQPGFVNNLDNAYHVVTLDGGFIGPALTNVELNGLRIVGGNANNTTLGGGVLIFETFFRLVRCTFVANFALEGGAVAIESTLGGSVGSVVDCTFLGNKAQNSAGAFRLRKREVGFVNCLFSGNSVDDGGQGGAIWNPSPIANDGGHFSLTNCTLVQNTAPNGAGGAIFSVSSPFVVSTIDNCVIWLNSPNQMNSTAPITVSYTNVQGVIWPGLGNISQPPQFIDADGLDNIAGTEDDNLRLEVFSTSIGAANGNDTVIPADNPWDVDDDGNTTERTPDLDATDRVVPIGVDMGCYECRDQPPCPWDTNGDGFVNIIDFNELLAEWGSPPPHKADTEPDCGDGIVSNPDFLDLLAHWGIAGCPSSGLQGDAPGPAGQDSPGDASGSGLTLEEALWMMGFASAEEYAAWTAAATEEEAHATAVILATLLGGG